VTADDVEFGDDMLLWSYGINLGLSDPDDTLSDHAAESRASQRAERLRSYVDGLLHDWAADSARLVRTREACAAAKAEREAAGEESRVHGWDRALEIIDAAMARLDDADVVDETSRERFVAALTEELYPVSEPYRQGPLHRHSLLPRLGRRLQPVWWLRRQRARSDARFEDGLEPGLPSYRRILISLAGQEVGALRYQVCTDCRRGHIAKLGVDMEGMGLGSAAVERVIGMYPDVTWTTSGQYDTAKSFWARHGLQVGGGCEHLQ